MPQSDQEFGIKYETTTLETEDTSERAAFAKQYEKQAPLSAAFADFKPRGMAAGRKRGVPNAEYTALVAELKAVKSEKQSLSEQLRESTDNNKALKRENASLLETKTELTASLAKLTQTATDDREMLEEATDEYNRLLERCQKVAEEQEAFRQSVLGLLGLDKKTNKTITELVTIIGNREHGQDPNDQTEELRRTISRLEAELAAMRALPTAEETLRTFTEERIRLTSSIDNERHRYLLLVNEVQMYREESKIEAAELTEQLDAAYTELKGLQDNLDAIHKTSSQASKSATAISSRVGGAKKHRCKHTTTTFDSIETSSSFSFSGSSHQSSQSSSTEHSPVRSDGA